MEEKKKIKINLATILLVIIIVLLIIMLIFILKLYKEKNVEMKKTSNLNNEGYSLQSTDDSQNRIINDVFDINNSNIDNLTIENQVKNDANTIEDDSINYIEMTESKYNEYNTKPYSFRIQGMEANNNGTITLKGRVFKQIEFLSLTKEQYNDLVNGEIIDLLGYQLKVDMEEDPDNGGYDLLITSTDDRWLKFYVEKNSDGSGKLHWYTESEMYIGTPFQKGETGRFVGTDIYAKIDIDENINCEYGYGSKTLRNIYDERKSDGLLNIEYKNDTIFPILNDELIFEDGICTSVIFSGE